MLIYMYMLVMYIIYIEFELDSSYIHGVIITFSKFSILVSLHIVTLYDYIDLIIDYVCIYCSSDYIIV